MGYQGRSYLKSNISSENENHLKMSHPKKSLSKKIKGQFKLNTFSTYFRHTALQSSKYLLACFGETTLVNETTYKSILPSMIFNTGLLYQVENIKNVSTTYKLLFDIFASLSL